MKDGDCAEQRALSRCTVLLQLVTGFRSTGNLLQHQVDVEHSEQ